MSVLKDIDAIDLYLCSLFSKLIRIFSIVVNGKSVVFKFLFTVITCQYS